MAQQLRLQAPNAGGLGQGTKTPAAVKSPDATTKDPECHTKL